MSLTRIGSEQVVVGDQTVTELAQSVGFGIYNYGPLTSDPTLRPDDTVMQVGDEYHNTVTGKRRQFDGVVWNDFIGVSAGDLADATDPEKGAGIVGRSTVSVDSISELIQQNKESDKCYRVKGYHAGTSYGGGDFYWDATHPKSNHNGGTVISPTVPWDGSFAGLGGFLARTGETQPTGYGCFVRVSRAMSIEDFGGDPSGVADSALSLKAAIEYGAIKAKTHGVFRLDSAISVSLSRKKTIIELDGVTLLRGAGVTAIAVSVIGNAKDFYLKYVELDAESASNNDFFNITGARNVRVIGLDSLNTTVGKPFRVNSSTGATKVAHCDLSGPTTVGSKAIDVRNLSRLRVYKNNISGFEIGIDNTSTNVSIRDIEISDNSVDSTYDTSIFCRIICTDGVFRTLNTAHVRGNRINRAGKAAIKFEIPNGTACEMRNLVCAENSITGFGLNVVSAALHYISGITDGRLRNLQSIGNTVTSYDREGNLVGLSESSAQWVYRADNVNLADIIDKTVYSGGYVHASSGVVNRSIYTDTCLVSASAIHPAGLVYYSCSDVQDGSTVKGAVNGAHGVFVERTRGISLTGKYNNNAGYGIYLTGSGSAGQKTSGVQRIGVEMRGNGLGPYSCSGALDAPYDIEHACIDDTGNRHYGTTSRRDALGFPYSTTSPGFIFINSDTKKLQSRIAGAWYNADGTSG